MALFRRLLAAALCLLSASASGADRVRERFNFDLILTEELHKAVRAVPGGSELAGAITSAGGRLPTFDMQDFGGNDANARFTDRWRP